MGSDLSLTVGEQDAFTEDRADYLAHLVAPLDDMWASFAEDAKPFTLRLGGEVAGSGCVDDEGRLLRFFVRDPALHASRALLQLAVERLEVGALLVFTQDPRALGVALELARGVEVHSLVFAHLRPPAVEALERTVVAMEEHLESAIAFHEAATGAPREFLEGYDRERIQRGELVLSLEDERILCAGELRRDASQPGVAQLGVVVAPEARGRGIASRMLTLLAARARAEGDTPVCSTEADNVAARKAIERAGFRALHRLLEIDVGFLRRCLSARA